MGLFEGKKGMVLGVANDFSIAWAITQKLLAEGAEVGFTHLPGEKMERRVRKLAVPIGAKVITPCDVQNDEDVARVFDLAKETYGSLDFVLHSIAFAPIEDLKVPFLESSRQGFKTAMDISVYSLASVARHASRVLSEGGSILTLTYLGGEKVIPGYNLMGVCKAALDAAVKYLAYDLGPKKIRINAVSAGPVKTLAASAVGDFEDLAGLYVAVAPLGRNVTREEVGSAGMFLLSDLASGITGEIMHVDCGYSIMGSPGLVIEAAKQAPKPPRERPEAHVHPSNRAVPARKPIKVGIGLIGRDGRFLVRKRPAGTVYAGYWEFPGGKCESVELPAEAVERECFEETGLRVVVGRRRRVTLHRYPHGLVELHFHDCTLAVSGAEPATETGFRWVPAQELSVLRFPEANDAVIAELVREAEVAPEICDGQI